MYTRHTLNNVNPYSKISKMTVKITSKTYFKNNNKNNNQTKTNKNKEKQIKYVSKSFYDT